MCLNQFPVRSLQAHSLWQDKQDKPGGEGREAVGKSDRRRSQSKQREKEEAGVPGAELEG